MILCFFCTFSVENGEKVEKEGQAKEEEKWTRPRKAVAKKEKKPSREGGFQIWTELDIQRNKFMVILHLGSLCCSHLVPLYTGHSHLTRFLFGLIPRVELPLQELLQPPIPGAVHRLCPELHSAVLQSKGNAVLMFLLCIVLNGVHAGSLPVMHKMFGRCVVGTPLCDMLF